MALQRTQENRIKSGGTLEKALWDKIESIVDAALTLSGEERDTFVIEKCSNDQALMGHVTQLLNEIQEAEDVSFLEKKSENFRKIAASAPLRQSEYVQGDNIGPYQIEGIIASGGMGSVYKAQRADGAFEMCVAIKFIKIQNYTGEMLRRFELERQILAKLQHPNIARLLDGGVTKNGVPYIILEFVNGTPIGEYCQTHNCSIEERILLFKQVLQAVRYAHENLVIHRDLKPGNILVDESGTVKILDFGISKLLEDDGKTTINQTQTDTRPLTIKYAAPEQIRQENITTATDLYALGVVFYELLAGTGPYEIEKLSRYKIEQAILNEDPPKPSKKLVDVSDKKKIEGDLDAIALKAIRKEVERRYRVANEFLEDLNGYQNGLPVSAREGSVQYRMQKFLGRHKFSVVAATVVLFSLITGIGLALWQAERANDEARAAVLSAEQSRITRDFVLTFFEAADPNYSAGRTLTAEQMLEIGTGMVLVDSEMDSELRVSLIKTLIELYLQLGELEKAKSLVNFEGLDSGILASVGSPSRIDFLLTKARTYRRAGEFSYVNSILDQVTAESIKCSGCVNTIIVDSERAALLLDSGFPKDAAKVYERLIEEINTTNNFEIDQQIVVYRGYASTLFELGNFQESVETLKEAKELLEKAETQSPVRLASVWRELGVAQEMMFERDEAWQNHQHALTIREKVLGKGHPATLESLRDLARLKNHKGDYLGVKNTYDEILKRQRQILGDEHPAIIKTHTSIGWAYHNHGDFKAGLESMQEAWHLAGIVFSKNSLKYWSSFADVAWLQALNGKYSEAESNLLEILSHYISEYGSNSLRAAYTYDSLGWASYFRGDFEKAKRYFEQSAVIYRDQHPEDHIKNIGSVITISRINLELGQFQNQLEKLEKARKQASDKAPSQEALAQLGIGQILLKAGKNEEAIPMLQESYAKLSDRHGESHMLTLEARLELAKAKALTGKQDEMFEHAGVIQKYLDAGTAGKEYLIPRLQSLTMSFGNSFQE